MIILKNEKYCENCPDFEPDVTKETMVCEDKIINETTISCKYRDRCREIYKQAKDECKKGE